MQGWFLKYRSLSVRYLHSVALLLCQGLFRGQKTIETSHQVNAFGKKKPFLGELSLGIYQSKMKKAYFQHLTVDCSLWLSFFALQNDHKSILMHILLSDFSFTSAFNLCCIRKIMFLGTTCLPNAQMITLRSSPPYQNDLWVCDV